MHGRVVVLLALLISLLVSARAEALKSSHRLPPALPTQFSADVSIVSHLTDPRQRYPPSTRHMRIQYDWEQQVAKAEMVRGFEANKTYVRRYDQQREYMVKHGQYRKCERAYLGMPASPLSLALVPRLGELRHHRWVN